MTPTLFLIAKHEWRSLWRDRVAAIAALLAAVLLVVATANSVYRHQHISEQREKLQHAADEQWHAQPDRHPHRVAHYGTYAFRPPSALAFFDFGTDSFTGNTLFLEAHRQNTANFSEARQASLLLRFGELSPALILQQLFPLLIVFLGYASIAAERERGTLRLLIAQGISGSRLLAGKVLALTAMLACLVSPAVMVLLLLLFRLDEPDVLARAGILCAGYTVWLAIWIGLTVAISSGAKQARTALLTLLTIWLLSIVVLPRLVPALVEWQRSTPTRVETDIAIAQDVARIGDSHNPDDPHFQAFKASLLNQYGVDRVEDLPVNYGALVLQEGERISSELFARHMQTINAVQADQSEQMKQAGLLVPLLALRSLSMAMAGTDRQHAQHFFDHAEAFRYQLIQRINQLHATEIAYQNDKEQKLNANVWDTLPTYQWQALPLTEVLRKPAALYPLPLWLLVLVFVLAWRAKQLERMT